MKNWIVIIALVFLTWTHSSSGDVVIDLRKISASAATRPDAIVRSDATTRPDADNYTVSVLAVPDHDFATKFQTDGHVLEISGTIKSIEDGKYQISIDFSEQEHGMVSVSTTIELKMGDSVKLAGSDGYGTIVMTLAQSEPKNEKTPWSRLE